MASFESEILKTLNAALIDHMNWSMSAAYAGQDNSIAFTAGFRQGVYKGLKMALDAVEAVIEDKAKKDDLL
jgi:hypothetical protein